MFSAVMGAIVGNLGTSIGLAVANPKATTGIMGVRSLRYAITGSADKNK